MRFTFQYIEPDLFLLRLEAMTKPQLQQANSLLRGTWASGVGSTLKLPDHVDPPFNLLGLKVSHGIEFKVTADAFSSGHYLQVEARSFSGGLERMVRALCVMCPRLELVLQQMEEVHG